MKRPHITLSELAAADILEQADWYEVRADPKLAKRWEKAVTSTLLRIAQGPNAGAPCGFASEALRGTRRVPVPGFPKHLIFYQLHEREVVVLRVIHGARDLESIFSR